MLIAHVIHCQEGYIGIRLFWRMDLTNSTILDAIFNDLLITIIRDDINVLLCGKKSSDADSIRNIVNEDLRQFPRINVFFPEWLFSNLLEQTDADLISLEGVLANDVDKIILPLEGFGAICELGAFSIKKEIRDKLIVLNDKQHAFQKSFINLGPIKLIKKKSKGTVIIYDGKLSSDKVLEIRNKTLYGKYQKASRKVDNMFTLLYLVGLVIAIYQPIEKEDIASMLTAWRAEIEKRSIDPALESLIQFERIQVHKRTERKEYFALTRNGSEYYRASIDHAKKLKQFYRLRAFALWTKKKKTGNFDASREKAKLLENS